MNEHRILVLGYGNPGRQDDGLGPTLVEYLEAHTTGITVDADYQLNIEDAAAVAEHDVTLFVDASIDAPEPFCFSRVEPASAITFTSHSVSPESVLAMCDEHFGKRPQAYVLGIRGYDFEFKEGLSRKARANLEATQQFVMELLRNWREQTMDASGVRKKTILTIDDDPDIRASIRVVLEAAGYAVGEAINAEEGLKVIERSHPDAIIVDLMMENVDSGSKVAQRLKEMGFKGPVYMLSSAGDTVRYNIDARDLGLAGIFQKPISPETLVSTLKAKLK